MRNEAHRQTTLTLIKEAAVRRDAAAAVRASAELLASSGKSSDVSACAATLARLTDAIVQQLGATRLKIHIVRSVTVEPVLPALTVEGIFSNFIFDLNLGGYGSFAEELLNPTGSPSVVDADAVFVILDLEDIAGGLPNVCAGGKSEPIQHEIDQCVQHVEQMLRTFRIANKARIVMQGFVVPDASSLGDVSDANLPSSLSFAVAQLNQRLAGVSRAIADCVFFDVDRLAARFGRARWRDTRMFYSSRLAVAADAFRIYAQGLVRSLAALYRAPRKVLCTDLDGTLWGGVLGEAGIDGIETGSVFPGNCYLEYQKYLKQLSARGVLLAIVSKNNETDVREAFAARAADLAIGLDDFVALKISWDDKAKAIGELAEELSLSLDSFVFVDDNPVECEAVRQQLPEVAVVQVTPESPWRIMETLTQQAFFDTIVVTEDDVNRLGGYKAQAQRAQLEHNTTSREEFLASLGIQCSFHSALRAPLARTVQLLAKTNQFNVTTRRHSAAEVETFAANGQAWVIRVRDKFGEAGVVGVVLARYEADACVIDSFLLSCRVIGRGIETALLAFVAGNARQAGATRLIGEFVVTKKNAPSANFYSDHGFTPMAAPTGASESATYYEFNLAKVKLRSPSWIAITGIETNDPSISAALAS